MSHTPNQRQVIDLMFPFIDGGAPRRRKDSYTLKIKANTGGDIVNVYIATDNDPHTFIEAGAFESVGLFEHVLDISTIVGICKSWMIRLRGEVGEFRLTDITIDFGLRPEQLTFYRHLIHNLGPQKKRARVWPVIIDTLGNDVDIIPTVDGVDFPTLTVDSTYPKTHLYQFVTDVFGVDYAMKISSQCLFELYDIPNPEIVQILPIAKRFDQIGSEELFRYGKIIEFDIRIIPFAPATGDPPEVPETVMLPYEIFFEDSSSYSGEVEITNNIEASYRIMVPKTTAGTIFRFVLGPTAYPFHRFYTRVRCAISGRDSDNEWILLGAPTETGRNYAT